MRKFGEVLASFFYSFGVGVQCTPDGMQRRIGQDAKHWVRRKVADDAFGARSKTQRDIHAAMLL